MLTPETANPLFEVNKTQSGQLSTETGKMQSGRLPIEVDKLQPGQISTDVNKLQSGQPSTGLNKMQPGQISTDVNKIQSGRLSIDLGKMQTGPIPTEINKTQSGRLSIDRNLGTIQSGQGQIPTETSKMQSGQIPTDTNKMHSGQLSSETGKMQSGRLSTEMNKMLSDLLSAERNEMQSGRIYTDKTKLLPDLGLFPSETTKTQPGLFPSEAAKVNSCLLSTGSNRMHCEMSSRVSGETFQKMSSRPSRDGFRFDPIAPTWRLCHPVNIYVFINGELGNKPQLIHIPMEKKKNMSTVLDAIQQGLKLRACYAVGLHTLDGCRVCKTYELDNYRSYVVTTSRSRRFQCLDYGGEVRDLPLVVTGYESKHVNTLRQQNKRFDLFSRAKVAQMRLHEVMGKNGGKDGLGPQEISVGEPCGILCSKARSMQPPPCASTELLEECPHECRAELPAFSRAPTSVDAESLARFFGPQKNLGSKVLNMFQDKLNEEIDKGASLSKYHIDAGSTLSTSTREKITQDLLRLAEQSCQFAFDEHGNYMGSSGCKVPVTSSAEQLLQERLNEELAKQVPSEFKLQSGELSLDMKYKIKSDMLRLAEESCEFAFNEDGTFRGSAQCRMDGTRQPRRNSTPQSGRESAGSQGASSQKATFPGITPSPRRSRELDGRFSGSMRGSNMLPPILESDNQDEMPSLTSPQPQAIAPQAQKTKRPSEDKAQQLEPRAVVSQKSVNFENVEPEPVAQEQRRSSQLPSLKEWADAQQSGSRDEVAQMLMISPSPPLQQEPTKSVILPPRDIDEYDGGLPVSSSVLGLIIESLLAEEEEENKRERGFSN